MNSWIQANKDLLNLIFKFLLLLLFAAYLFIYYLGINKDRYRYINDSEYVSIFDSNRGILYQWDYEDEKDVWLIIKPGSNSEINLGNKIKLPKGFALEATTTKAGEFLGKAPATTNPYLEKK